MLKLLKKLKMCFPNDYVSIDYEMVIYSTNAIKEEWKLDVAEADSYRTFTNYTDLEKHAYYLMNIHQVLRFPDQDNELDKFPEYLQN